MNEEDESYNIDDNYESKCRKAYSKTMHLMTVGSSLPDVSLFQKFKSWASTVLARGS